MDADVRCLLSFFTASSLAATWDIADNNKSKHKKIIFLPPSKRSCFVPFFSARQHNEGFQKLIIKINSRRIIITKTFHLSSLAVRGTCCELLLRSTPQFYISLRCFLCNFFRLEMIIQTSGRALCCRRWFFCLSVCATPNFMARSEPEKINFDMTLSTFVCQHLWLQTRT